MYKINFLYNMLLLINIYCKNNPYHNSKNIAGILTAIVNCEMCIVNCNINKNKIQKGYIYG
ncbi:hypothetical protein DZE40_003198 [Clostridium beijerinckii]|uniref:Uncharacterized protein n=1 Tax=Clostridium beijerinckii TaxID=1520 RepID=A0A1S8S2Z4_CLOBE|nr:hypothetical protein [Clostridium beijerinckii]OOM59789.1 hypothetical protein CLBCK_32860 [Clostridium beijerinckii]